MKIKILITIAICGFLCFNEADAQTAGTNNTLGATGITGIQSTTAAGYKLSTGGAVKIFGAGAVNTVGSPTLFLGNNTATTGRKYGFLSNNNGYLQLYDSALALTRFIVDGLNGRVGIGTFGTAATPVLPDSVLHIIGGFKLVNGTQGVNKVLVSDAAGGASWQSVTYARMQAMTANRLLGSGLTGTGVSEITLGTGLSFTGTTLNATGGGVTSFIGRTGAVIAAANDYSFAQIGAKPTTLAGYGIIDAALATHNHTLDALGNVLTTGKLVNDQLRWNGTNWVSFTPAAVGGWGLTGNAGTTPATNFIGTTDNQALLLKTNNIERLNIGTDGSVRARGLLMVEANSTQLAMRVKPLGPNGVTSIADFYENTDPNNSAYGLFGITNSLWGAPAPSVSIVSTKNGTGVAKDIMFWAGNNLTATNAALTIKANTGLLRLDAYKNNAALDSVLSTDINGNVVLKKFAASATADSSKWTLSGNNIFNKNSGNVGIGTATPSTKLEVAGAVKVTGTGTSQVEFTGNNSFNPGFIFNGATSNTHAYTFDSQNFFTNPSGNSFLNGGQLQIYNNAYITAYQQPLTIKRTYPGTGLATTGLIIDNTTENTPAADYKILSARLSGTEVAYIAGSGDGYYAGKLGIGTTNPLAQLHTTGTVRWDNYKNNATLDSVLTTDANGNVVLKKLAAAAVVDSSKWTLNGNNIFNKNSGNIGIGIAVPTQKLHVVGNALVTGNITSPGTGFNSEKFGLGATANFLYGTAIGNNSSAGFQSTALGTDARAIGDYSVSLGASSFAAGFSVALGRAAVVDTTAGLSIAMGYSAHAQHVGTLIFGSNAFSTATNQAVFGSATPGYDVRDFIIGHGAESGYANTYGGVNIRSTDALGVDIAGANLAIKPGRGTGTAKGGDLTFATANLTGTSGATRGTYTDRMKITSDGKIGLFGLGTDSTLTKVLVSDGSGYLAYRNIATLGGGVSGWGLTGNAGTTPGTNFLGTSDNNKLLFKTNGVQHASIGTDGTINFETSDTAAKPAFRFYPNGDFVVKARREIAGNVVGPNNGLRYNAKYGLFEVGTDNNFDTTLATTCCGSQAQSALIINSDFINTFKGAVHGSVVGGDAMTLQGVAWSSVFGESHNMSGAGFVNKSMVSGWGQSIKAELRSSISSGDSHQINNPFSGGLINGYVNTIAAPSGYSTITGILNSVGGAGQLVSGAGHIVKTPFGNNLGNKSVDFTSIGYVSTIRQSLDSMEYLPNLGKYPLFSLGNSKFYVSGANASNKSNALTILYNGRTQINTTGFSNNLTEANVTPKAALEVVSNNSGVLLPKLTTAQIDSIIPADRHNGLLLYNTDSSKFQYYDGNVWKAMAGGSGSSASIDTAKWVLHGDTLYNKNTGNVGIGTATPTAKFDVAGKLRFRNFANNTAQDSVLTTDSIGNLKFKSIAGLNGNDNSKWLLRSGNIYSVDSAKIGIGVDSATARLHTMGSVRFGSFKNNLQGDSVLTTDTSGNLKMVYMPFGSGGGGGTVYAFKNGLAQTNGVVSLGGQLEDSVKINLAGYPFSINNGVDKVLNIAGNGNVGIGTAASVSAYRLAVNGDANLGNIRDSIGGGAKLWFNGSSNNDKLWMSRYNTAPGNTELRVNIGGGAGANDKFNIGYDSANNWNTKFVVQNNGQIGIGTTQITSDISAGAAHGTKLSVGNTTWAKTSIISTGSTAGDGDYTDIQVPGLSSNTALFRINSKGQVGIGTSTTSVLDSSYRLSVNGKIRSKGLRVQSSGWADFVFEPGYKLMSLTDVDKYIKANNRLPQMPAAAEVIKEGNDVGETQIKLLQKIEELTLYMIEQNKRLKELEEKNKGLEAQNKEINDVKKQLEDLKQLILNKK